MLRRRARLWTLSVLALLGLATATPAADSPPAQGGAGKAEPLDAEMLRDLEVLNNPDFARDREVAKRMRFLERLRMLEALRTLENPPPGPPPVTPAGPVPKEVK